MTHKKLRVALVGLGIGRQHALAYKGMPERFSLDAVCSLEENESRAAANEFGVTQVLSDFDDVLALPDIDVVDICTPPYLHAQQAEAALRAGKHVICEKPLAASLAIVDTLARVERESGKRLMPIFQYRFGAGVQKMQKLIRLGLAGAPLVATVEVHWRRRASYYTAVPWRGKLATELGGVLISQAIHALDMLMEVVGPAKRVYAATMTRSNAIEVEDCAAISLEMVNGALATVSATLGSSMEISRHRFVFDKLTAESNTRPYSNGGDPWTYIADMPEQQMTIDTALAGANEIPEDVLSPGDSRGLKGIAPPAGFDAQMLLFHAAIVNNRPLPVTIADARRTIELLTAIYTSAQTHRAVELPLSH